MKPERITSLTDPRLLGSSKPLDQTNTKQEEVNFSPRPVANLAQDAELQRKATIFRTNTNRVFALPEKYNYAMFEGNGNLNANGNFAILVTGPFGGGKNSLVDATAKVARNIVQQVVEHTSREKRPHETEGKEYYFVTLDEFQRMASENELLVWGDLTGNFYGYSIKSIQDALNSKKVPIFVQGPNNAGPLKDALETRGVPTILIFVSPLSQEELNQEGGIDKAVKILEDRMEGTQRNRLKERSEISRAMFESLPGNAVLIDNSNGNLDRAVLNLLSLIHDKKEELKIKSLAEASPQLKFLETGELPEIHLDTTTMKVNKNIAIIVTGPSGVGKDTLFRELGKELKFTEPLSHTTRPIRKGEEEGVNYYYVSVDEFKRISEENNFVEWVMVHNNQFYGKTVGTTQRALDSGNDLVYALNVSAREYYKAVFEKFDVPHIDVFISPISKEELEKPGGIDKAASILEERIRKRNGGETEEQIQGRLKVGREWLQQANKYSIIIANEDGGLDKAVNELKQMILTKKSEVKQELDF